MIITIEVSLCANLHVMTLSSVLSYPCADRREDEIPASSSQEVANRSRWHSLLYEAGGISAAVSEESMRRLKFCLQWLQVCLNDYRCFTSKTDYRDTIFI